MSTTFKFGNKNWAWKEGSVLAYNDENNNFKPLPFDFTRSSSATRVNKDGLIEVVGSDEPRVDYLNNADGHLLLEPSRTNLVTYSESAVNSTPYNSPIVSDNVDVSPDGNNTAFSLGSSDAVFRGLKTTVSSGVSNNPFSTSIFVKKASSPVTNYGGFNLYFRFGTQKVNYIIFDEYNGTMTVLQDQTGNTTTNVEDFGTYWRFTASATDTGSNTSLETVLYACLSINGTSIGAGVKTYTAWGWQFEEGSYATSYIPTSGSSVTRNVDEILNSSIPSGIYGSSKGSVYIEGIVGTPDSTGQMPFTGGVGTSELIYVWIKVDGKLTVEFYQGGAVQASISTATGFFNVGDSYKIAVAYQNNDFVVYANGSLIGADSSGTAPNPTTIRFGSYTSGNYKSGIIKNGRIYNTRLTNAELATLTSI